MILDCNAIHHIETLIHLINVMAIGGDNNSLIS